MNLLEKITNRLTSDTLNFISVTVENTGELLERPNKANKSQRPTHIYYEDIKTTGLQPVEFLKAAATQLNSPLLVELRRKNGTTSKPTDVPAFRYALPSQAKDTKETMSQQPQQPAQQPAHNAYGYGMPEGMNAGMMAVVNQMSDIKAKALRSDDLQTRVFELQKENLETKTRLNEEIREIRKRHDQQSEAQKSENKKAIEKLEERIKDLDSENRELKVFKETAAREMALALKESKNENTNLMDTEGFKEILKIFPQLLPLFNKNAAAPIAVDGMAAPVDASQVKKDFVKLIVDHPIPDSAIIMIHKTGTGLQNPDFTNELQELLTKYNL